MMKVRIPKNQKRIDGKSNSLISPTVTVQFKEPVTETENLLAMMLLHIAKESPDVVTMHQMIRCSDLTFPPHVVARICNIPVENAGNTLPNDVFVRIITALQSAQLVATFTCENVYCPYLPVTLLDMQGEPAIIFEAAPQCYFTQDEQNGEKINQIRICGELKELFVQETEKYRNGRC